MVRSSGVKILFGLAVVAACVASVRAGLLGFSSNRSPIGVRLLSRADSGTAPSGEARAILADDSATFLFFLDSTCVSCSQELAKYVDFARWAAIQRAATRFVVRGRASLGTEFTLPAGAERLVVRLPAERYAKLGPRDLPATMLVDETGVVRGTWIGKVPNHGSALDIMDSMNR
jgi:hypothetical protein